jgi:hypothetical protein
LLYLITAENRFSRNFRNFAENFRAFLLRKIFAPFYCGKSLSADFGNLAGNLRAFLPRKIDIRGLRKLSGKFFRGKEPRKVDSRTVVSLLKLLTGGMASGSCAQGYGVKFTKLQTYKWLR